MDCDVETEHFLGCHQNLALVKQARRKSRPAQHRNWRNSQFLQLSRKRAGNSEAIRHGIRSPNIEFTEGIAMSMTNRYFTSLFSSRS